jgi:hypothetical protein
MDVKPRRPHDVAGPLRRHPAPAAHTPQPQQASQPVTAPAPQRRDFTAPQDYVPRRRRWWKNLLFPLAILVCLSASFVVQSLPLGVVAIALYAAIAWIRHLPSRVSFVMAFLALLTVVVLLVVRQNVDLAGNFATYTFLLLVVGVISTMLESRVKTKPKRSKIPHLRG